MYDEHFFDLIRGGCQRSAALVAPIVYDYVRPNRVLDIGCGEGWWGAEFETCGAEHVQGCDGDYVAEAVVPFRVVDIDRPGSLSGYRQSADLVVCLEVAEHLRPMRALSLIEEITQAGPVVLFSAAIPGQGGVGHHNERWPTYWAELFERRGFMVSDLLRWALWDRDEVEPWYRQNMLVAAHQHVVEMNRTIQPLFPQPLPKVRDVVHPVFWRDRGHAYWPEPK